MIRFTIFPYLPFNPDIKPNPYIQDFVATLNKRQDTKVINRPHKNPLLNLLFPSQWGDVFIFNWYESIPDFKYGILQTLAALSLLTILYLKKKKIIWVLHNKRPHATKHLWLKKILARFIARKATLVLTHARDGIKLAKDIDSCTTHKTYYICHPTKNRLSLVPPSPTRIYDLLIWGHISKYKGIFEFVEFVKLHTELMGHLRICIVGDCAEEGLFNTLQQSVPSNITCIHHSPTFEELGKYISQTNFVIIPYQPESILSSGILMDSLSFGAKIIGPHTGSFKDYEEEGNLQIYTFTSFNEIPDIIANNHNIQTDTQQYIHFLKENDWNHFAEKIIELLQMN